MKDRTVMSFREVIVVHCLILFLFDMKRLYGKQNLKINNNKDIRIENVIC